MAVKVIQGIDKAIFVMRDAGKWLEETGKKPSKWWRLENLNRKFLLQYAKPQEFYVAQVDGKPAAVAILQFSQNAQDWVDAVSEHSNEYSEQRANLLREGYKLYFKTVLELPDLDKQPSKHWSDYQEQDINFVTLDLDSEQTLDEEMLRLRMGETLGFWSPPSPIRIGVFNVGAGAHKFVHEQSASTVIEYIYGEIFRRRVVLHLNYEYSDRAQDWHEKGISYDLFGISGDQLKEVQSADEMDLLLAANAAAALYAREIRQTDLQSAS